MAVPKRRQSNARTGTRRAHDSEAEAAFLLRTVQHRAADAYGLPQLWSLHGP